MSADHMQVRHQVNLSNWQEVGSWISKSWWGPSRRFARLPATCPQR